MAYKLKHKNLEGVVEQLHNASKMHAKQADIVERHIKSMEKSGAPSHNPLFGKNKGFKRAKTKLNKSIVTRGNKRVGRNIAIWIFTTFKL